MFFCLRLLVFVCFHLRRGGGPKSSYHGRFGYCPISPTGPLLNTVTPFQLVGCHRHASTRQRVCRPFDVGSNRFVKTGTDSSNSTLEAAQATRPAAPEPGGFQSRKGDHATTQEKDKVIPYVPGSLGILKNSRLLAGRFDSLRIYAEPPAPLLQPLPRRPHPPAPIPGLIAVAGGIEGKD